MIVAELFNKWAAAAPGLRSRTRDTITHTLAMSRNFMLLYAACEADELDPVEMAAWGARNQANVRYVKTVLGDCALLGLIARSPLAEASSFTRSSSRDFIPTREQVDALAAAGEKYGMREYVLTGAFCGGRLSALAGLAPRNVFAGPSDGVLKVLLKRKGRPGYYPTLLLADAVPTFQALMRERRRTEPVLLRPSGKPWTIKSVSERWVQMRGELRLPEACTSHCLRKFYATHLLDLGVSRQDVALLLDHVDQFERPNTEQIERVYGRPSRDAALERVAGLAA